MCEANVYILDENGREQLILDSVDRITPTDDGLVLESIFSEKKLLKAVSIKEMTLVDHRILLERIG